MNIVRYYTVNSDDLTIPSKYTLDNTDWQCILQRGMCIDRIWIITEKQAKKIDMLIANFIQNEGLK